MTDYSLRYTDLKHDVLYEDDKGRQCIVVTSYSNIADSMIAIENNKPALFHPSLLMKFRQIKQAPSD
jgi:hypothetical protein